MSEDVALVLGGRSDMGIAIAHQFASNGYTIQLAARSVSSLQREKADLEVRYQVPVTLLELDAVDDASRKNFFQTLEKLPNVAICVIGYMGEQIENEQNTELATTVMRSNFEGPANLMSELALRFSERGTGTLVGISSVAGERGRASNYIYGAAKAGFTAYLSGLRNRLVSQNVRVITVLPGFVNTKMTAELDLPKLLTAEPEQVATAIERAIQKNKDIVYVLPIWRIVMLVIRGIPECIFKRTNL